MAAVSISSESGGGSVDYSDGTSMSFTAGGKYCTGFKMGGAKYEYEFFTAPGVDGQGSKNLGYRGQMITLDVTYVSSSEEACIASADGDNQILAATPSTLTAGGESFLGCFLESFDTEQTRSTGLGDESQFYMKARITLDSKRLA